MSKREPAILLDDIRTAIAKIERYTAGLERTGFLRDEETALWSATLIDFGQPLPESLPRGSQTPSLTT